jgi:hypothetical protein
MFIKDLKRRRLAIDNTYYFLFSKTPLLTARYRLAYLGSSYQEHDATSFKVVSH